MANIHAKWTRVLDTEILQRSSQVLSVVAGKAYIFGGELRPREPRDNDVHILDLDGAPTLSSVPASTTASPSRRVGSASTTLNNKIYLFSGRGGLAMTPIEEKGDIWEFNPSTGVWTAISPTTATSPYPPARSYHTLTSNGKDTLYLHGGCPEKGRLSDLWSFNLVSRSWTELSAAPDPPRGGTSIAFADGFLYRMNGFDGKTEQGGSVDAYNSETNSWESFEFLADGKSGPVPRSVGALLPVRVDGEVSLVTLFGERDPSALGHQGAGKMLGDVWVFDVKSKVWTEVEGQGDLPCPRGWFAADISGESTIVVQGGLDESNQRLGDVWVLSFERK